jgi:Kef-type K+ transport system membrane component KefB
MWRWHRETGYARPNWRATCRTVPLRVAGRDLRQGAREWPRRLGVEPILATFVAGVACSFTFRTGNRLFEKVATIGHGFFVPIFFISAGFGVRLSALLSRTSIGYLLAILVGTLLIRLLAIPLLRMTGLAWNEAASAALLLAAPLTLQVAIVKVGIATGQVAADTYGAALGAAVVGALLYPLVARAFLPRTEGSASRSASWSLPVRSAILRSRLPK